MHLQFQTLQAGMCVCLCLTAPGNLLTMALWRRVLISYAMSPEDLLPPPASLEEGWTVGHHTFGKLDLV